MQHILIIILLTLTSSIKAQVKPTPVEFLFGNNRIQGQTILIKNFGKSTKFGIFSLATVAGDYKNVNKSENELFSNIQLNYDINKGIKITSGATFSSAKGFTPIAGLEYVFNNKNITLVVNPTLDLVKNPALANFALIEYAPKNEKLNLYARLQGLYVQNISKDFHERSSFVVRAGFSYKGFASGLGLNQDYYGPLKISKQNLGIFLSYKFI